MRAPTWSAFTDLPDDLINPMAVFRDRYGTTVFVGTNASTDMAALTYDSAWAAHAHSHALDTTAQWPGGQMHQNCWWWGGWLWVIGDNVHVYRGTSYSAALTDYYSASNAQVLFPVGEHMYLVDNTGLILRTDATRAAFETYYDPIVTLDVMFGCGLRGNIVFVARMADGTMKLYRLPDQNPIGLHELAHIPATGQHATGIAACIHNDDLYLMPGYNQVSAGGATYQDYDLFCFDGSSLAHLDRIRQAALTYHNLLSWNDRLLLHTYDHTSHNHLFYALVGKGLTGALPTINNNTSITYMAAFPCGDDVVVCGDSPGHGFWHAGRDSKSDGSFITSYLDMGYPGLLKRLHRITVLCDGKAASYTIDISHRPADTTT